MDSTGKHRNAEQAPAAQEASLVAGARLTAYILGELEAEERAAVERELAASEELRREVAEIRQSVDLVAAGLAAEATVPLPQGECLRVIEESRHSPKSPPRSSPDTSGRGLLRARYVLAASLLLVVVGASGWLMLPRAKQAHEMKAAPVAVMQVGGGLDGVTPADSDNSLSVRGIGLMGPGQAPPGSKLLTTRTSRVDQPVAMADDSASMFVDTGLPALDASGAPRERSRDPRVSESGFNTESYDRISENPFLDVRQNPLSTFSIDVDTASYANVRRFLNGGSLPPKDAVRIEEMLNYFTYHYAPPADDKPFAVHAEVAGCPWEPKHRLLRVALKGREVDLGNRPASNLVFLIDVSGSMDDPAKLPLLKSALQLLVEWLGENDRVAMVVYAGSSGLVLPSTSGLYKETIQSALDRLQAGGSTNGASGIQLAYQVARENFIRGGTNRVILCTDGDFNVGITDQGSLTRLIEREAESGVFLSVLGFGTGNLKDSSMEKLADRGNGNYAYLDTANEARKVLVEQLGGTLVTIAKDVKLQLEFNPHELATYRLIGYENRLLRAEDFNDDTKDAGEIGAGHTVTALYELVPAGGETATSRVDELKYQSARRSDGAFNDELLTLKLRYKQPDGDESRLIESVVKDSHGSYAQASEDFRFAAAVAGFGLLLRDSQYKGNLAWGAVIELAQASRGIDEHGYRAELIELVKKAAAIAGR